MAEDSELACLHCGTLVDDHPDTHVVGGRFVAHGSCWAMLTRELPQFCCKGQPTSKPPRLP